MKVYFHTLGCRVNQYETDAARELFFQKGFEQASSPEEADVCVVNTCTVTGEADRKSRQMLRKMIRANDSAVVVAMGCAAEVYEGTMDCDVVVGRKQRSQVAELAMEALSRKESLTHKTEHHMPALTHEDNYCDFKTALSPEGTRAYVKIQDGCNNFCSYCIIPFARGRAVSRDTDSILNEVSVLASKGYKEIVLTGIDICAFGTETDRGIMSLYDVICSISDTPGIERIRLNSMEPMTMSDEFIEKISGISKVCPHFHISAQSGSDTVLRRMNRKNDAGFFLDRVDTLRKYFPDLSLTTDIICGFPGETDEEFRETLDFCRKADFSKIHVFPYSVRKGTVAAKMKQTPSDISKKRVHILTEFSGKQEELFAQKQVGKTADVLLEKRSEDGRSFLGYTANYVYTKVYSVGGKPVSGMSDGELNGIIVRGVVNSSDTIFAEIDESKIICDKIKA